MNACNTVIIVPCYNEAARLDEACFRLAVENRDDLTFLFVNDGSTDETESLLHRICRDSPRLHYISPGKNQGKAEAVRKGLLHAIRRLDPDYLGYWDADLATPLEEIDSFVSMLDSNPHVDAAIGSRVKLLGRNIERNMLRHYLGRVFATFASLTLKMPVYDTQCGAKLFRNSRTFSRALGKCFSSRWIFDVELFLRLNKISNRNYIIHEIPLMQWIDKQGSKVKPSDFFTALFGLAHLYIRYSARESSDRLRQPGI